MPTPKIAGFRTELLALLPRLRRYALARVSSPAQADDLVQATCERAWKAQEQWIPGTRMDCWLFTIMHNLHIDEVRAQAARPTEVDTEYIEQIADHDDRDWTRKLEAGDMLERVAEIMAQLPSAMREVLMLVPIEGLSYREAAHVLGVPVGTVMSRLARARAELMRRLGVVVGETDGISA